MDDYYEIFTIEDEEEKGKALDAYWHKQWLAIKEREAADTRTDGEKLEEENAMRTWFEAHPSA